MLIKERMPRTWPQPALLGLSRQQPRALGKGKGASTSLAKWPSFLETLAQLSGVTWCLSLQFQYNTTKTPGRKSGSSWKLLRSLRQMVAHLTPTSPSLSNFLPSVWFYSIFLSLKRGEKTTITRHPKSVSSQEEGEIFSWLLHFVRH